MTNLLPVAPAAGAALDWWNAAIVAAYAGAQLLIVVYSSHRWLTLWRWRTPRSAAAPPPAPAQPLPRVAVQLPLYNERRVVTRLIDAAAALDYPASLLEIQVLDDSTDETTALAAARVAHHRARGVPIRLLHRDARDGNKAGALAAGLAATDAELVAVFDADFVPAPDFLTRMTPHFADPRVGMAQARWGHLNREESALTSAQAVMLDSHFLLEHAVRMERRLFFNFNGTAGVWRRSAIEGAGGWSDDTLTEDLDLSYRAQLAGWRFVFDPTVVTPAELPADIEALKSQQRRWAKGSIQTARKVLGAVWASRIPLSAKVEAVFHLTSNATYPLLLVLALLLLPVMLGRSSAPPELIWAVQGGVIALGILPVMAFLAAGQWAAGRRGPHLVRDVLAALAIGVGLSVNNARAVLDGLAGGRGAWERTPKAGDAGTPSGLAHYVARGSGGRAELGLALYFAALSAFALTAGQYRAVPFTVLLVASFALVGLASLRAAGRRAATRAT